MKKLIIILLLASITAVYIFFSCKQKQAAPEKVIAETLLSQVDSFATLCKGLQIATENNTNEEKLQQLFLQVRLTYKKFEWAAEYFEPAASRAVNGPPMQEAEASGQIFEPAGLQVIEALLFPAYDITMKAELIKQLKLLQTGCGKYKTHFKNIDILNWQVFDAVKLEIFRIETLGITGFDNPLTQKSMEESAAGLASVQNILAYYSDKGNAANLKEKLVAAMNYLQLHIDFNSFNRAEFITLYCNPITAGITDLEAKLKVHIIRYNRLLNQDARTLFDTNAFNADAYAPDPSSFTTPGKINLGKLLFADPILSGTGTRSCQSCHQPEKAFTDGLVKNTIIDNNKLLKRNTPTLINSALQPSLFYDLRVNRLEEQSLNVVQSNEEMHGSLQISVKRLWQDGSYHKLFSTFFLKKDRTGIDTLEVMNAIGSYVRSLVMLNSRFDEYMHGSKTAMSAEELNGFNLFMGKAKCATCHYMPLFNGTFPPRYIKTEAEVIGVPQSLTNNEIDSDMGRYDVLKIASFRHAFKTPTIRNAAVTAPYMHNGVFITLEQVVDFYNKGGGKGLGINIGNQTLPFDELKLSDKESNDIISFIKSLDSR